MAPEILEHLQAVQALLNEGETEKAMQSLAELAEKSRKRHDALGEGVALANLAAVKADLDDPRDARKYWQAAASALQKVPGGNWELVRSVYWPMARFLRSQDEIKPTEAAYQKAIQVMEKLAPGSDEATFEYATLLGEYAGWWEDREELEQAEHCWDRATAALQKIAQPAAEVISELAGALEEHAAVLDALGRSSASVRQLREAHRLYSALESTDGMVASLANLSRSLWKDGDIEESRRVASEAAALAEDASDAGPSIRADAFENQARALISLEKEEEADVYFQLAEVLYRRQVQEDDPDRWIVRLQAVVEQRAAILSRRKNLRGAAVAVQEFLDFWKPYLEEDPQGRMETYVVPAQRLALLYQALGETDKTESVLAEARVFQGR